MLGSRISARRRVPLLPADARARDGRRDHRLAAVERRPVDAVVAVGEVDAVLAVPREIREQVCLSLERVPPARERGDRTAQTQASRERREVSSDRCAESGPCEANGSSGMRADAVKPLSKRRSCARISADTIAAPGSANVKRRRDEDEMRMRLAFIAWATYSLVLVLAASVPLSWADHASGADRDRAPPGARTGRPIPRGAAGDDHRDASAARRGRPARLLFRRRLLVARSVGLDEAVHPPRWRNEPGELRRASQRRCGD